MVFCRPYGSFPQRNKSFSITLTRTPAFQILDDRLATTACDYPYKIFVTIIYFLVFSKGRNKSKVTWSQRLALLATFRDNGSVSTGSVYYGILLAVMVNSRRSVWFCKHYYTILVELNPDHGLILKGVPEAQSLSDISAIAPFRIMPSVWPPLVSRLEPSTFRISPGIVMENGGVNCTIYVLSNKRYTPEYKKSCNSVDSEYFELTELKAQVLSL